MQTQNNVVEAQSRSVVEAQPRSSVIEVQSSNEQVEEVVMVSDDDDDIENFAQPFDSSLPALFDLDELLSLPDIYKIDSSNLFSCDK